MPPLLCLVPWCLSSILPSMLYMYRLLTIATNDIQVAISIHCCALSPSAQHPSHPALYTLVLPPTHSLSLAQYTLSLPLPNIPPTQYSNTLVLPPTHSLSLAQYTLSLPLSLPPTQYAIVFPTQKIRNSWEEDFLRVKQATWPPQDPSPGSPQSEGGLEFLHPLQVQSGRSGMQVCGWGVKMSGGKGSHVPIGQLWCLHPPYPPPLPPPSPAHLC